jgi:serine/threonine-protein kinase HipA
MPRRISHDRLRVFLNRRLVGLVRGEISGAISFQYDGSWPEWESALPASLSLPLLEQAYRGAPVLAIF